MKVVIDLEDVANIYYLKLSKYYQPLVLCNFSWTGEGA